MAGAEVRRDHPVAALQVALDVGAIARGKIGGNMEQNVNDIDIQDNLLRLLSAAMMTP